MSLSIKAALALLFGALLPAQVTVSGSLVGVVVDPSQQTVAAAKVILTSQSTNFRQASESSPTGSFQFAGLQPGLYDLSVEKVGFQRLIRQGITVEVNKTVPLTLALTVGEVSATVTVSADAPAVQSQSSDISLLVDGSRIRDLPLNGKDFQKLTFLAPGSGNFRANNANSNSATSGTRETGNNYVIDGITANDERETAGLALGASFRQLPNVISTEALAEFRVITSNADATFGRGSGAQINVVTKSGTNQLHGSAYEYLRNSALDARDFFNRGPFFTSDGRAKTPPFRQNLFGGTVGGPIVKNRHFFFGSYEGFRQRLQQTSAPILPSASLVGLMPGNLGRLARSFYLEQRIIPETGFANGTIRAFSPADRAAAVAAGFPGGLFDGEFSNGEAATIVTSQSSTRDFDQDSFLIRTDHRFGERWNLGFRYAQAKNQSITNASGLPGTGVLLPSNFYSPVAQATWTISPSRVLELRAGLMRRSQDYQIAGGLPAGISALGIDPEIGVGLSLAGTTTFQLPTIAPFLLLDNQTVPQFAATYTWSRSKWTIRSGADFRPIQANFENKGFRRASYSFVGLTGVNGLLGASPNSPEAVAQVASQTIFGQNGGPTSAQRGWRSKQQEYFTHADWRVFRHLTLNFGLRYSYFGVYNEVNNALANLYATGPNGIDPTQTTFRFGRSANQMAVIGGNTPFYQRDLNNFQPRVGLAWNLGGRDSTVLRAAWGMYNDRLYQLVVSEVARNTPLAVSGQGNNIPFVPSRPVPINAATPVLTVVDPTLRNPTVYRYNFAVEQRFGRDTTVTAAFVGTRGADLYMTEDPNFAGAYPQASRPDTRFSDQRILRNLGFSRYSALQVYGRRRFANGLTWTAAYTYSRYRDMTSTDTIFGVIPTVINTGASAANGFQIGPTVQRPLDSEYGRSENDAPHVAAVSYLYELPMGRGRRVGSSLPRVADAIIGGWNLSGLLALRSGNVFDVQLGQDINDDGAFNDRPALASGATLAGLRGTEGLDKTQWLLPQANARTQLVIPGNVIDPFASIQRNSFRAPTLVVYDMSLNKRFRLTERVGLNLDANFFNLFNRANFRPPVNSLTSPFFGQIQATAVNSTPRQIQLGLKLVF